MAENPPTHAITITFQINEADVREAHFRAAPPAAHSLPVKTIRATFNELVQDVLYDTHNGHDSPQLEGSYSIDNVRTLRNPLDATPPPNMKRYCVEITYCTHGGHHARVVDTISAPNIDAAIEKAKFNIVVNPKRKYRDKMNAKAMQVKP